MKHLMLDGLEGYRSRFDDIRLMHEILEEIPGKLGAQPIMPPFVLPYYDGVDPEDVGLSGMVLLRGGHCTIHTFSYAECYFADIMSPNLSGLEEFQSLMGQALPCATVETTSVERDEVARRHIDANRNDDFGPHYTLNLKGFKGPRTLDRVFDLLDSMPGLVGMTPIMRPMVLRDQMEDGSEVLSGMTMIAESHMALHVFPERAEAYFDLFSCRFFNPSEVTVRIRELLPADQALEQMAVRGRSFERRVTERSTVGADQRKWRRPTFEGKP